VTERPPARRLAGPPLVAVFADESCLGNGRQGNNPGGAGGVVEYARPDGSLVRRDFWISEPATTNNRMALRSVIEAFRGLSSKGNTFRVVFTSDSRYLIDGMNEWVPAWMRNDWRRKTGQIENLELWQEAVSAVDAHQVRWEWVRGHHGHVQNEYANHLATRAAAEQTHSRGLVPSRFDDWLAQQRAKGRFTDEPVAFPSSASFQAGSRAPRVVAPEG
jgi:ribonuclease HI